jgi:hypothetical protein
MRRRGEAYVRIVEAKDGVYRMNDDGSRSFLCAVSPERARVPEANAVAVSCLDLGKAVPAMNEGKCPLCEGVLRVVSPGSYACEGCGTNVCNDHGYVFPRLLADEVICEAMDGTLGELTTTGIGVAMPSLLNSPGENNPLDYCPKCNAMLDKQGACPQCDWKPGDEDRLWEEVVRVLGRVCNTHVVSGHTMEFDTSGVSCKISLSEAAIPGRFRLRLADITHDRISEITGRPVAIINWIVGKVSKPDHRVNTPAVNSHISETGRRLALRESGGYRWTGSNRNSKRSN